MNKEAPWGTRNRGKELTRRKSKPGTWKNVHKVKEREREREVKRERERERGRQLT